MRVATIKRPLTAEPKTNTYAKNDYSFIFSSNITDWQGSRTKVLRDKHFNLRKKNRALKQ